MKCSDHIFSFLPFSFITTTTKKKPDCHLVSSLTNSLQSKGSISACDLCIFNLSDSSIDEVLITCTFFCREAGVSSLLPYLKAVSMSGYRFPTALWVSGRVILAAFTFLRSSWLYFPWSGVLRVHLLRSRTLNSQERKFNRIWTVKKSRCANITHRVKRDYKAPGDSLTVTRPLPALLPAP